jgi:hypothetical protein
MLKFQILKLIKMLYNIQRLPHIKSKCGRFIYFQSGYNMTWWKHYLLTDRPNVFIGINPPKNP